MSYVIYSHMGKETLGYAVTKWQRSIRKGLWEAAAIHRPLYF